MIAYPNINHCEIIYPVPYKYIYSSLSNKEIDKTVFTFNKKENDKNLLIVEISSCKGDFSYQLTNSLKKNAKEHDSQMIKGKGKKIILARIKDNTEYYLSIFGLKEDELLIFDDFNINNNLTNADIDFLLYYYTMNEEEYSQENFDSKFTYEVKGSGVVVLNLPIIEFLTKNNNHKIKAKEEDLSISVIITENYNEFEYMDSICYLSKKNEIIQSRNLYKDYKININKNKNRVEISNLDKNKNYYVNILINNKQTGQFLSLDALQITPNWKKEKNISMTLILIGIIVLIFIIFYFYRKFKIVKDIVNNEINEINDMKKLGSVPKSIHELKNIKDIQKNKYDNLTEDSSLI